MALEGSLRHTYENFKAENPQTKLSYSKFVNIRPKNVLPMAKQKILQCLCEYCINIDFKIQALKSFCSMKEIESVATDRYESSRLTLCPKDQLGFYR